MGLKITVEPRGFDRAAQRLNALANRLDDLEPAMAEIGRYMVRSTQNRILSSKTGPDGKRWARISKLTESLKGDDQIMFQSGELYRSIRATQASRDYVNIRSEAPYAPYLQRGVKRVRGRYRSTTGIPERPFLGISEENKRRIAKIISGYLRGEEER